jgi:hypothetical protein
MGADLVRAEVAASKFRGMVWLTDLEEIRQLKARYCRFLDAKDWAAWRTVFADDFSSDTTESGGQVIVGADQFVQVIRDRLGRRSQSTVHQVHSPEISLTSATTATGVWAMQDVVRLAPGLNLLGYGHYHETYEKVDGSWVIRTSRLTRLREDLFNPLFSFRVPPWLRDAGGSLAQKHRHDYVPSTSTLRTRRKTAS